MGSWEGLHNTKRTIWLEGHNWKGKMKGRGFSHPIAQRGRKVEALSSHGCSCWRRRRRNLHFHVGWERKSQPAIFIVIIISITVLIIHSFWSLNLFSLSPTFLGLQEVFPGIEETQSLGRKIQQSFHFNTQKICTHTKKSSSSSSSFYLRTHQRFFCSLAAEEEEDDEKMLSHFPSIYESPSTNSLSLSRITKLVALN